MKARLIILPALLAALLGFLLSEESVYQPVHAFSSGPPAGFTNAPGEENCAECHVPAQAGTGQISITAPQNYIPGQIYPITVTQTNADPTRLRWGFQLTVLDGADERAGTLISTDTFTQVLTDQGPGGSRQYIQHNGTGTFIGQQGGASWTFNWQAPATDVGTVLFYAAGNHANNDGNTSGDHIYFTFVASAPSSATPDFTISATPATRSLVPGNETTYSVTVTPLAGFTGAVDLSIGGLPAGANAVFNPTTVNISDANAKSSIITVNTTAGTPLGNHQLTITGQSGSTSRTAQVELKIISAASVDLSVTKTASPNPAQVGLSLTYRIEVSNSGPAAASNVTATDTLPTGVVLGQVTTSQGLCSGTTTVSCALGNLAAGANAVITIMVTPSSQGQIVNTVTATANETDHDADNNSASVTTFIEPAANFPSMLDPNLTVDLVVNGLSQPTSMAFIGPNDFLVLEKASGRVQRVTNGSLQGAVLDLPVNSASERGLLGIALHPQFSQNGFTYLFWTESSTGVDETDVNDVELLANRVDRYIWSGSALQFDRNLIRLRALQHDAGQSPAGNHDGGVLRFGQDGKLYIMFGDVGRRGFLQNITSGGPVPDDQFGGPEPDDAHLSGVILRLNDDGSTPVDNPFFNADNGLTGQAAENIKKLFAYGIRNSFGMDFDPLSGDLWTQENGDDAFDELNRVTPGFNGGWIQIMGPVSRINEFRSIEMNFGAGSLQQIRWPPSNIATSSQDAIARLYMLPGALYRDPEFSWKYAVAPSPIGFVRGRGLGPNFEGDLLVGASRTTLLNGYLFRFKLDEEREHFVFDDPLLADRVADNSNKFDLTESETLVAGRDFGITTDIQTGPNGSVYVVSLSRGAVYEIKAKPPQIFTATLNGQQEVPPNASTATGTATLLLSADETTARLSLNFSGLSSTQTDAHIHGPAPVGMNAGVLFPLPSGQINDFEITLTAQQVADLKNGLLYVNVHTANFLTGEIRGQFQTTANASAVFLGATVYSVNEAAKAVTVTAMRMGDTSSTATVDYFTLDDLAEVRCDELAETAYARCDYVTTVGTLTFEAGETAKSFSIPIIDDSFKEQNERFSVVLRNPTNVVLGAPTESEVIIIDNDSTDGANPIFNTPFFVRQHYLDFLTRDPEAGEPWTAVLNNCSDVNNNPACDRLTVSAAFFGSPEFQLKGYFVYRFYKLAFNRLPTYPEISFDMAAVTGQTAVDVFSRKAAFTNAFAQRTEFTSLYNSLSNEQYVEALMGRYSLTQITTPDPANPDGDQKVTRVTQQLIDELTATTLTRAQVLRMIADSDQVFGLEFNQAFVAMQYFGYLRRAPEQAGFDAWLNYLNANPTDFRTMVNGFMNSIEYRLRFGPQ